MSEIILGAIIIGLIVDHIYLVSKYYEANEKYMKAFMARNLTDLTQSEIMKEVDKKPQLPKEEFIPIEDADESVFKKYLKSF